MPFDSDTCESGDHRLELIVCEVPRNRDLRKRAECTELVLDDTRARLCLPWKRLQLERSPGRGGKGLKSELATGRERSLILEARPAELTKLVEDGNGECNEGCVGRGFGDARKSGLPLVASCRSQTREC
jgi:hypothetical protein